VLLADLGGLAMKIFYRAKVRKRLVELISRSSIKNHSNSYLRSFSGFSELPSHVDFHVLLRGPYFECLEDHENYLYREAKFDDLQAVVFVVTKVFQYQSLQKDSHQALAGLGEMGKLVSSASLQIFSMAKTFVEKDPLRFEPAFNAPDPSIFDDIGKAKNTTEETDSVRQEVSNISNDVAEQRTYIFPDGRKYVGEYRDGKRHGKGTFTFPDGNKYVGEFRDGMPNGQGICVYANGNRYDGGYRDGSFHGQGTFTHTDGRKYVGEYRDGKRHGQGTWTDSKENHYVGEHRDGKQTGLGIYIYLSGDTYVGEHRHGRPHGQGVYTFLSDLYTYPRFRGRAAYRTREAGGFRDAKIHGLSYSIDYNKDPVLGEWRDGELQETSGFYDSFQSDLFEGTKSNDDAEEGTYTFSDGSKYVGELRFGIPHGQGTLIHTTGAYYVGGWRDGKQNGRGIYAFEDRCKYVLGEWKDNRCMNPEEFISPF